MFSEFEPGGASRENKLHTYSLHNFRDIPGLQRLTEDDKFAIEVVAQVLPFKTNNYVIDQLIDWDNVPDDPIFQLTFPQGGMLKPNDFAAIADLLRAGAAPAKLRAEADRIRGTLNPHPAGQMDANLVHLHGNVIRGIQHKYNETVLFFPQQGQTCHAYCTFCFRWPQFVGRSDQKLAMRDVDPLIDYVKQRPQVTDILFTGGDPLVMGAGTLAAYIRPILDADIPHLQTIRIGTKVLGFWPQRVLTDGDADDLLALMRTITEAGKHLALMAHVTHPRELQTDAAREAVGRIRATGAEIRTQAPVLNHINADPDVWAEMWRQQVKLGMHPYYMFIARDTGAQHYFAVPLAQACEIYRQATRRVSGLARTAHGPSMSAHPGKVQITGVTDISGKKVFVLQFLQGRNSDWVLRPFFAAYDERAIWFDELKPAFGESKFFFEGQQSAFMPAR